MSGEQFDLDGHCLSQEHPWSIPDLSLPNAQLAGVFAGFMLLAITTLLAMSAALGPAGKNRTRVTETIVLLGLGIVVLAQNSYFFGSIAATKPPDSDKSQQVMQRVCERGWVQFMPAAGMLAVGAVLLVAGLAWMIAWHRLEASAESENSDLVAHANVATAFVLWGVMAALLFDMRYFVQEMHQELHALDRDAGAGWQQAIAIVLGFILCFIATWILIEKRNSLSGEIDVDRARILPAEPKPVYAVAVWTALYLVLNFLLTLSSTTPFVHSHPLLELWAGIGLCVFGPGILFVLIAFAMPGTNGPWPRRLITLTGSIVGIALLIRGSMFIFQQGQRLGVEDGQCRLGD